MKLQMLKKVKKITAIALCAAMMVTGFNYGAMAEEGEMSTDEVPVVKHEHHEDYVSNNNGTHSSVCDAENCTGDYAGVTDETCDTSGNDGQCSKCGYKAEDIPEVLTDVPDAEHEHNFKAVAPPNDYKAQGKEHELSCECGYEIMEKCEIVDHLCTKCHMAYFDKPASFVLPDKLDIQVGEKVLLFEADNLSDFDFVDVKVSSGIIVDNQNINPAKIVKDGKKVYVEGVFAGCAEIYIDRSDIITQKYFPYAIIGKLSDTKVTVTEPGYITEYESIGNNKHKVILEKNGERTETGKEERCDCYSIGQICSKCGATYVEKEDTSNYGKTKITDTHDGYDIEIFIDNMPSGATKAKIEYPKTDEEKEEIRKKTNDFLDSEKNAANSCRGKAEVSNFFAYRVVFYNDAGEKIGIADRNEISIGDFTKVASTLRNKTGDSGSLQPVLPMIIDGWIVAATTKCKDSIVRFGKCGDNLDWRFENNELTITGYGEMTSNPWWYSDFSYVFCVKELHLPEGLTSIPDNAFSGFLNLKSVNIPGTVKTIGDSAFYQSAFSELIIPEGVEYIGEEILSGSDSVKKVVIPSTVKRMGATLFGTWGNGNALETVVVPCRLGYTAAEVDHPVELVYTHDLSDEYACDGANHWRECDCGYKTEPEPCTYVNGICSVCNIAEGQTEHVHKYVIQMVDDYIAVNKQHIKKCECGYIELEKCEYDGNHKCKVCGIYYFEYPKSFEVPENLVLNVGEKKLLFVADDESDFDLFYAQSYNLSIVDVIREGKKVYVKGIKNGNTTVGVTNKIWELNLEPYFLDKTGINRFSDVTVKDSKYDEFEYVPAIGGSEPKHKLVYIKDGARIDSGFEDYCNSFENKVCIKCGNPEKVYEYEDPYLKNKVYISDEYNGVYTKVYIDNLPAGVTAKIEYPTEQELQDIKENIDRDIDNIIENDTSSDSQRYKGLVEVTKVFAFKVSYYKDGQEYIPDTGECSIISTKYDTDRRHTILRYLTADANVYQAIDRKIGDWYVSIATDYKADTVKYKGKCGDNLYWKYENKKLIITGYGDMTAAPWKYVDEALAWCTDEIVLPEGITSIADYAFISFYYVKRIDIPGTVKRIGRYAFSELRSWDVILNEGIETIEDGAFSTNYNMKSIVIPNSVKTVGSNILKDCTDLESVTIPCTINESTLGIGPNVTVIKTHPSASTLVDGETTHWMECACGEKTNEEDHIYTEWIETATATHAAAGSHYRTCTVCGHVDTQEIPAIGHTYGTEWIRGAENHWHECDCGEKKDEAAHSFSSKYNYNADEHWQICICGETSNLGSHSFGEWTVISKPSYTTEGIKQRDCACGYYERDTIPRTNNIETITVPSDGEPESRINTITNAAKQYIYNNLTPAEQLRVDNGESIKLYTKVNSATFTVTQSQRNSFEQSAGDSTVGLYLDIELYAKVGDLEARVVQPGAPITVEIEIPEVLRNNDPGKKRWFRIMHLKSNGDIEELIVSQNNATNTLKFTVTSFSPFAIAYDDETVIPGNSGDHPRSNSEVSRSDETKTIVVTSAKPYGTLTAVASGESPVDIKALNSSTRDKRNQAIYANYYISQMKRRCSVLETVDIYAPHGTSELWKVSPRVLTWKNTGLKKSDTVYVVWYCQEAHDMRLIPAIADDAGTVYVSLPRVGGVSTVSIVKANK